MSVCDCVLSRKVKIRQREEKSAIRSWWSLYLQWEESEIAFAGKDQI